MVKAVGIKYNTFEIEGANYIWTVTSDATITSGQGTHEITVDWGCTPGVVALELETGCNTTTLTYDVPGLVQPTLSGQAIIAENQTGTSSKAIQAEYLKQLSDTNTGVDAGDYLQDAFRNHANTMEQRGYDWYEANSCAAFWARRSIDGTAEEFYAMLQTAMGVFDPGFAG